MNKWSAAVLSSVLFLLSACASMFDMSPTPDSVIAAQEAAHVAALVKTLHEAPHHGIFGAEAEQKRVSAAARLGELKAYSAIPDLALALKDENWEVRLNASGSLSEMSDHAQAVQGELREALKDQKIWVRLYSAFALYNMDAATTELIPVLTNITENDDINAAVRAADLAITIEKDPKDFVPVLMKGMDDPKTGLRIVSVMKQETQYPGYLPVLLKGTRSESPKVRLASVNLLGAASYASPQTTDTLRRMATEDPDEGVRMNATQSLVTGGGGREVGIPAGTAEGTGEQTVALLLKLVQGEDWQVRKMAIEALRDAKRTDPEFIAALIEHLGDPENDVRMAAADALGSIKGPARAAVPKLWTIYNDYIKAAQSKKKVTAEYSGFANRVYWTLLYLDERPAPLP